MALNPAFAQAGTTGSDAYKYTREHEESDGKTYDEVFNVSQAKYQLRVYVKKSPTTGNLYISAITLVQTHTDAGEEIPAPPKKDPTPGGDITTYETSQLEFQNKFVKTEQTPPSPYDQPYELSKRVTGVDQDEKILHEQMFDFQVTMTLPDGADKKVYKAYYWDSDNGTSFTALNEGGSQKTTDFDFTTATGNTITVPVSLGHDQKITFNDVPAGTTFTVIEDDYFTTGVEGSNKDSSNNPITYKLKAIIDGGTVPTDDEAPTEAARTAGPTSVPQGGSAATAYVNDGNSGTTPAGIVMQYLPFFVMIALAIAALAALTIAKGARRARAAQ